MPGPRPIVALALTVVAGLGVAACGGSASSGPSHTTPSSAVAEVSPAGDIPDSQAFVSFSPVSGGYTIEVPEGWARTDLTTGASFTDKLNSIRVESTPAPTQPTDASVRATEVPALQSSVPGFVLGSVSTVPRTAGDAVLVTYQQQGEPDAVTAKVHTQDVERYEFWRAGMSVTITLTSPKGADNVDPWKTVTSSFGWR